jgi:hypothetical protein
VESVTTETTGGNWLANQEQRGRESDLREKLKIKPASPVPPPKPGPNTDSSGDPGDKKKDG